MPQPAPQDRPLPRFPPPRMPGIAPQPRASGAAPLQGLTVLAVEDSRYASDALRLMCQRSGARLRRAEDITSAAAHLRCYRPDVVIVDIGLPDGDGAGLIARIAAGSGPLPLGPHLLGPLLLGPLLLGMSGDPEARAPALAAGAKGFLDKPVPGLLAFQAAILAHLPDHAGRNLSADAGTAADPMALADDLRQAERALAANPPPAEREWIAGFLAGIARQSQDSALAAAAHQLRHSGMAAAEVADFLRSRIGRQSLLGL